MECHSHKKKNLTEGSQQIALIGNPNVGKSVIFGVLTGKYVTVSNYPGTTVEVAYGNLNLDKNRFLIIDTPGVNTLIPMSEDEKVTRDILLKERLSSVIQVADAKNLRRALLITLQLIEMRLPFFLVLNMDDEARSRGIIIESKRLSEILSLPVIKTVATQRIGIHELLEHTVKPCLSGFAFKYDDNLENAIKEMEDYLPEANISKRSLSVMILAGDESLREWLNSYMDPSGLKKIDFLYQRIQEGYNEPAGYIINKQRLKVVDGILEDVLASSQRKAEGIKESFGRWSMHPLLGVPIILAVLFFVYEFVGVFGAQTLVNFLEETIFGRYLNPWAVKITDILVPVPLLKELFVGDYGIITMALTYAIAIVLPIVGTFFIAFG
ncbi:MAG: ferrous iron transporter B, partial [Nitrospirae bacterium]|nr:ferrous iron transporter B [Nitrospirota bacterium]